MPLLSAKQWCDWIAYLKLYLLPHERADINATLMRVTAMRCAGAKSVNPMKLMPQYPRILVEKTEASIRAVLDGWVAASKRK